MLTDDINESLEYEEELAIMHNLTTIYNTATIYLNKTSDSAQVKLEKLVGLCSKVEELKERIELPSLEADAEMDDEIAMEAVGDLMGKIMDAIRSSFSKLADKFHHAMNSFKLALPATGKRLAILQKEIKSGKFKAKEGEIKVPSSMKEYLVTGEKSNKELDPLTGLNNLMSLCSRATLSKWHQATFPALMKDWSSFEDACAAIQQAGMSGVKAFGAQKYKEPDLDGETDMVAYRTNPDGTPGGLSFSLFLYLYEVNGKKYSAIMESSFNRYSSYRVKNLPETIKVASADAISKMVDTALKFLNELSAMHDDEIKTTDTEMAAFEKHYAKQLSKLKLNKKENRQLWYDASNIFTVMQEFFFGLYMKVFSYLSDLAAFLKACRA